MPGCTPLLMMTAALLAAPDFGPWQADIDKWESAIAAFEKLDQEQSDPDDAILFVGSSSIRLWETLAEDMQPYATIRRGYGGAKFSDVAYYADRIILPHRFRAVVIFVANDISGSAKDKTPAETRVFFEHILGVIRSQHPEVPVFCLAITPTNSRYKVWPTIRELNAELAAACKADGHARLIETEKLFLNAEGKPRSELFRDDQLHLNADGYAVWAKHLHKTLDAYFKEAE